MILRTYFEKCIAETLSAAHMDVLSFQPVPMYFATGQIVKLCSDYEQYMKHKSYKSLGLNCKFHV